MKIALYKLFLMLTFFMVLQVAKASKDHIYPIGLESTILEYEQEYNKNVVENSIYKEDSDFFYESPMRAPSPHDPNEDDEWTIGGQAPVGEGLEIILLVTAIFLSIKALISRKKFDKM